MYKHLLIATDGSDLAYKAVQQGMALAKSFGAKVTAITVTEPWDAVIVPEAAVVFSPEQYDRTAAANATAILDTVASVAAKHEVDCETVHVRDQFPAEGIVATAKMRGCDLIVMASHGRRGLARLLLGSETQKVLTHSTIPVLVYR